MYKFLQTKVALLLVLLLALPRCTSSERLQVPYDIKTADGKENLVPVLIIGSGPSGLSAALYAGRAGIKTVVVEGQEPGGQLTKTTFIENWPGVKKILGSKAVSIVREQAKEFGAEFFNGFIKQVDLSSWPFKLETENGTVLHAMALIIATGADPRYLGVPGEQKYWGSGVSACAICDAPFYKDEEVVIVGGGDSAAEEAMQLAVYAKKVTVLVRKGQMRASQAMRNNMRGYPNISIMCNTEIKEIYGDDMFVVGVKLHNNKTGETETFSTSGVFIAIGRDPNSELFKNYLDLAPGGQIQVNGRTQKTSVPGVFASGDVTDAEYRQAGVASGDGIKAGLDAERFLISLGLNMLATKQLEPSFFSKKGVREVQELESLITLDEFESNVMQSEKLVVLDFYTQSCPSCLHMMPALARVAHDLSDNLQVYKVDAELAVNLAQRLSIYKVPSLVLFKNGHEVGRKTVELTQQELTKFFQDFFE